NVRIREEHYTEGGKPRIRTWYETPAGTLSTLREPAGFTSWTLEYMFKSPDDYKALRFLLQDEQAEASYAPFAAAEAAFGEDISFRAGIGLDPLQLLVSGN